MSLEMQLIPPILMALLGRVKDIFSWEIDYWLFTVSINQKKAT